MGERLQGAPASTDGDETDGDETDSGDEAAELKPPHSSIKIQHEKIVCLISFLNHLYELR